MIWAEALAYVEKLNMENDAGYSNWRLPDIGLLHSLIEPDRQGKNPIYTNSSLMHCSKTVGVPMRLTWRLIL